MSCCVVPCHAMQTIAQQEGARIKNRNKWKIAQIEGMLQNLEITKLDIVERQQRMLQQAAITGKMPNARRTAKRKFKTQRKHYVWPYEGEEWADELGYYQIKTKDEDTPNSADDDSKV